MESNDERLRSEYNAEEPLKGFIERLNKCEDFVAAASGLVSQTQIVLITYRLVADTGQYLKDCWAWRTQDDKYWTVFQAHFIKYQANLRERQQTFCQGGYGDNNLFGIEEAFANLVQATAEDREAANNLTGANINLTTQVEEYANHMAIKDSTMATMKKNPASFKGKSKP